MTLTKLKLKIKLFLVVFALVVYGGGLFILGKHSSNKIVDNSGSKSSQADLKNPIEKPQPYADIQSNKVISSHVKLCANTFWGFEVSYPKDWFTTYNADPEKCLYFAPFSFVIPQSPDRWFVPIKAEVINANEWENTIRLYENPNEYQSVTAIKNIELNARSILLIEAISTGADPLPQGMVKTSYLIFDTQTPLVFTYHQLDQSEDPVVYQQILREIVSSLKYF